LILVPGNHRLPVASGFDTGSLEWNLWLIRTMTGRKRAPFVLP
jgi:hypothetical protein